MGLTDHAGDDAADEVAFFLARHGVGREDAGDVSQGLAGVAFTGGFCLVSLPFFRACEETGDGPAPLFQVFAPGGEVGEDGGGLLRFYLLQGVL